MPIYNDPILSGSNPFARPVEPRPVPTAPSVIPTRPAGTASGPTTAAGIMGFSIDYESTVPARKSPGGKTVKTTIDFNTLWSGDFLHAVNGVNTTRRCTNWNAAGASLPRVRQPLAPVNDRRPNAQSDRWTTYTPP